MRIAAFLVSLALSGCAFMPTPADQNNERAILAVLETWNEGWRVKDPKLAASGYSQDPDWTNAFGMSAKGRDGIADFLTQVFALPFVMAGQGRAAEQDIRFISPQVALVRTVVERTGQLTPDGKPLGTRQTHHLRVFHRTTEGWRIVSHLIGDARDPRRPRH